MKTNTYNIAVMDFSNGSITVYENQKVEYSKDLHEDVDDAVVDHISEKLEHHLSNCEYMWTTKPIEVNTQ